MWLLHRRNRAGRLREGTADDLAHLREFIRTRRGVEGYVEPRTTVTDTTMVLVAADGEWTRRRVASPEAAAALAKKQSLPLYDAVQVGYPQRMRDWTARRKADGDGSGSG